jgi:predicted ribosome quality control (RQC) complex YloA/Tae2 family protein
MHGDDVDMYDVLTIAAIVDELSTEITGARVQRLAHADPLTMVLEVYANRRRKWLTLSADHNSPRLLLASQGGERDADHVSPMLLLLRKYVRGGQIISISQPRYERIIQISIAKAMGTTDDDESDLGDDPSEPEMTYSELIIEIMGRRSNIMLLDETGRIREAIKRVPVTMSRVRPILPGKQYTVPPPQVKADPLRTTPTDLYDAAREGKGDLDRWLVSRYLAMSPILAREVVYRADVELEGGVQDMLPEDAKRVANALREVLRPLETSSWTPHLYEFDDGGAEFSAIELLSFKDREDVTSSATPTVLEAANRAWQLGPAAAPGRGDRHAVRRDRILEEIETARDRVQQRLHSLEEQSRKAEDAEKLREAGELIYAYMWMVEPGMSEIETPEGVRITLDPTISASENAQEYFERYRKAQSASEQIPQMAESTRQQLAYLDQMRSMVSMASSYDEIEAARMEWIEYVEATPGVSRATRNRGARPAAAARRPRQYSTPHGDTILVGRTSKQNETVTFDIASAGDLWLHARDLPGAHVIIRASGQEASEETVESAARLAAFYSDGRQSTTVPVDVTERRHVRKIRGGGPGMVTYRNEYTLQVRPASEDDLELTAVK